MQHQDTMITHTDHRRLRSLVDRGLALDDGKTEHLAALRQRVRKARLVNPTAIPRNVVTMNSQVVLRNLDSGDRLTCTLAYPSEAHQSPVRWVRDARQAGWPDHPMARGRPGAAPSDSISPVPARGLGT